MKKIISILLAIIIFGTCLASCSINIFCKHDDPARIVRIEGKAPTDHEDGLTEGIKCTACGTMVVPQMVIQKLIPDIDDSTENEYKLGMGIVVDLVNCRTGYFQIDATVATVVLDDAGKIVACRIDAVYNRGNLNDDGTYTITNLKTKMELGYDYNMAKYGYSHVGNETIKEWFEQAKAFEEYVVGKTADEIANMPLQITSNGYVISADQDLLSAGCTIDILDFKNAVVKACNDEQGVSFKSSKDFTLGVAANTYDSGSYEATDGDGEIRLYSDFAASVVVDGKIVACVNDGIQPRIGFDAEGGITLATFKGTKRELKGDYGMSMAVNYGMDWNGDGVVKEWYEQSAAFSKHVVGMTAAQVKAMGTQEVPGSGYIISNDDALLSAGCTIQIMDMKNIVAKSIENAR